jgi:uncharacterized protein YndB with AHSA1/START domain
MNDVLDSSTPPPTSRPKSWVVFPAAIIGLVAALLIWGTLRGNWIDAQARNPSSAAEGVVTQILRTPEGGKQIRAALIVAAAPERVWRVVADYDHFSNIFPHLGATKGVRDADGRWHVTGEIRSIVGRWPMDLHVRHEESPTRYTAAWDEPHGAWTVNRGNWIVTPHGAGETLLEYQLELKVSPFPDFVVRAVLLGELKSVLSAVAKHAQ